MTKDEIRTRFIKRTHDDWFEQYGRDAADRTYGEPHLYIWVAYDKMMGYSPKDS